MKFRRKSTGVILEPSSKNVEEMLKASEEYEEVKEVKEKKSLKAE